MNKIIALLFGLLVIAGCATNKGTQAPTATSTASSQSSTSSIAEESSPPLLPRFAVGGIPIDLQKDPQHTLVRHYSGFSLLYDERTLSPRWTLIELTKEMADAGSHIKRSRKFKPDPVIESAGLMVTGHKDYYNLPGSQKWNRGHMVQFDDARGYGELSGRESFFTSNICPQLGQHNQKAWLTLERRVTEFARDYNQVWVYTGPIYGDTLTPYEEGKIVPKPEAFYKIVVGRIPGGHEIDLLAIILPHIPLKSKANLKPYLCSVDDIELRTSLDFLPELPDDVEDLIEAEVLVDFWADLPGN